MKHLALSASFCCLLAGCYRPSEKVEGTYAPTEGSEAPSNEETVTSPCPLAEGAIELEVRVPEGFALLVSPEACMLVDERAEDPRLITMVAIPLDSDTPTDTLLLDEPDGVRRWAMESGMLGGDVEARDGGRLRLGEVELDFFLARGTPPDFDVLRDVLLVRHVAGNEQLVIMVFIPPDDDVALADALAALSEIRVGEGPP